MSRLVVALFLGFLGASEALTLSKSAQTITVEKDVGSYARSNSTRKAIPVGYARVGVGACLNSARSHGMYYGTNTDSSNLQNCADLCNAEESCTGFDDRGGGCLWYSNLEITQANADTHCCECYKKVPEAVSEVTSCDEATKTGVYTLTRTGEKVHCLLHGSEAYTLAAVVSSEGENWKYTDVDGNSGQTDSAWQSTSVFGSVDHLHSDYKGSAWSAERTGNIMITYNGEFLLKTAECKVGQSMKDIFANLRFNSAPSLNCDGSWKKCVDQDHTCKVSSYDQTAGDELGGNEPGVTKLYFKYGEAEGAEDGNKDRVMISSNMRGDAGNMLDYCQGLGAFSQIGSDQSVNVGTKHDAAVSSSPGKAYGIYVQLSGSQEASPQRFETCGATGNRGPDQAMCDAAYGSGVVRVTSGYQVYTVAESGSYSIEANGARGGNHGAGRGGGGAKVSGVVSLAAGDRLVFVVGQTGWDNPHNADWGGAGGGGTFVAMVVDSGVDDLPILGLRVKLLFAAGGGAGMEDRQNSGQAEGGRDVVGDPNSAATGGHSGGGGGYILDSVGAHQGQSLAKSFLNGALGGIVRNHYYGGFGGGGNPYNGGGGGGGYDGGDCNIGGVDNQCHGGSSFGGSATANVNDEDGYILLSKTENEATPCPSLIHLSTESIAHRPPQYPWGNDGLRLENAFQVGCHDEATDECGRATYYTPDRFGQYRGAGDPSFFFVIDLKDVCYIDRLVVRNAASRDPAQYFVSDYTVGISNDFSDDGSTVFDRVTAGKFPQNSPSLDQEVSVAKSGRYIKFAMDSYGGNGAAMKLWQVYADCGECFQGTMAEEEMTDEAFDCDDHWTESAVSGVYSINPDGLGAFDVWCDFDFNADEGGDGPWTVFQRRTSGDLDFYRNWNDYEQGFGTISGDHWLGLTYLHRLTASQETQARFGMCDGGQPSAASSDCRAAIYGTFFIAGSDDKYRVTASEYAVGTFKYDGSDKTSTAAPGDSFTHQSGQQFSTKDQDSDAWVGGSCAEKYTGAWWYLGCHYSNLNGVYGQTSPAKGLSWYHWVGYGNPLEFTQLAVRRKTRSSKKPDLEPTTITKTAAPCPADSTGTDVQSGCTCNAGYTGTIVATDSSPFFSGSCSAVGCPADSSGSDVVSGCSCNAGHEGTIIASASSPFYTGRCSPVGCPENSVGTDVVSGCTCADGYRGTIAPSATSPFYTGSCTAVACPVGSTGTDVASGCTCDAGYVGEIFASDAEPFYTGSCAAVPCPDNSHGENVASGCTCDSGFVGTITASETSPHFDGVCSADCEGQWSDWTTCSQSCGSGTQSRTYSVTKDLVGNGEGCPHVHGAEEGPHECNPKACPGEGFCESVAEWSEWGPCSHTCGDDGVQSRSRMVFPDDCEVDTMERACERHPCPVDCRLGEWSSWSVCSDECFSDGQQSRTRIVEQEPAHGGLQCLPCNPLEETRRCGEQPTDCQLTEWTSWTTCSKSCSTGTTWRDRTVEKFEKCGGHECVCNMLETMNCFQKECEIDCQVGTWNPWSKCPVDCGGGTQSRTRAITVSNSGGGQECPATIEFQNCGMDSCLKHCTPSQWSEWSECTATCYGTAQRTRHIVEQAASGGNPCDGLREVKYCNHQCPFDCQVGAWAEWDTCSKSCGFGTMTRKRPITQRVENGGAACPHVIEAKTCSCAQCPDEL